MSPVGWAENRRRQQHASSVNWELLVLLMLGGHEGLLAERNGRPDDDLGVLSDRRDAIVERVGGLDYVVQTVIDTDYAMQTNDKDAVLIRALEICGYTATRAKLVGNHPLFPPPPPPPIPPPVATAAAGWYPDPSGQDQLRWWDGTKWTDHRHG